MYYGNSITKCPCIIEDLLRYAFGNRSYTERLRIINNGRPMPVMPNLCTELKVGDHTITQCFQVKEYTDYTWLTGCPVKNKLYCWPCILFSSMTKSMWTSTGYKDVNNLYKSLVNHDCTKKHKECMRQLCSFGDAREISRFEGDVKRRRHVLSCFINAICFLAKQDLPFREYYDGEMYINRGHYVELLNFTAEYDEDLQQHLKDPNFSSYYPEMLNQLIDSVSSVFTDLIREEIRETKFVSIILNETSGKLDSISGSSWRTQISVSFRYVKDNNDLYFGCHENKNYVIERFLKFIEVKQNMPSDRIFEAIDEVICDFGVGGKLICLTYDGAATLSKGIGELQAKIKEKYPRALFIHNHNDDLNFILEQSLGNIKECAYFFKILSSIGLFFTTPYKRINLLNNYMWRTVKKESPTSLEFSTKLVHTVKNTRSDLIGFFEDVVDDPDDHDSETVLFAGRNAGFLKSFDTCFLLDIISTIFSRTHSLSRAVQTACYNTTYCCQMIEYVKGKIKEIRTEKNFKSFWDNARQSSSQEPPEKRKNVDTTQLYRKLFCDILDNVLIQITHRFAYYKNFEFATLLDPEKFEDYKKQFPEKAYKSLLDTYKDLFDLNLRTKLDYFYDSHVEYCMHNKPLDVMFRRMKVSGLFSVCPEVYKLFQLIVTLPTTVKPSYSTLKKIKLFTKSTVYQEKPEMALLYIEKGFLHRLMQSSKFNFIETVIKKFCTETKRNECIYRETAAEIITSADRASTSFLPSYESIKTTLYKEKHRILNEGKSSSSASAHNNEGPNLLPVENEEVSTPDVEMQCSESTAMETQSTASTNFISNSDIVYKQEIIETQQYSSPFDYSLFHSSLADDHFETHFDQQRASTPYQAFPESSNLITDDILPDGQANAVAAMAPTLSRDLETVKVVSDIFADTHDLIAGTNGMFSNEPSTVNAIDPVSLSRNKPIQPGVPPPVISMTVPKNSPSNEAIQTLVSSHAESTSLPRDLDAASHGDSCKNESTQTEGLTPPRDKFNVFGEFIASKLRNLDPKSSAFVQTAFLDLITNAEFGMFLNRNELSTSATPTDSIQKVNPLSNESQTTHGPSGKENIHPAIPSPMGDPDFNILSLESSSRNETVQSKVIPHKARSSFPPVISNVGPENSARNEPNQPRIISHIGNLRTPVPESLSSYSSNQTRVAPYIVSPAFPPDLKCESSSSNKPSHPKVPLRVRPRDEFDVYGEHIATKLRNLDPRSCAFVQIAFADLIFEAELGRFLSEGEKSIFANKTNDILKNMPAANDSALSSLSNVVSSLSKDDTRLRRDFVNPAFYGSEVPLEMIPNWHSFRK